MVDSISALLAARGWIARLGGGLPIALRIDTGGGSKKSKKTRVGRLEVRVKLGDLPRVLEKIGSGEMRVTLAVWEPKTVPFVRHDQKQLA
jgi:hypothetical protein